MALAPLFLYLTFSITHSALFSKGFIQDLHGNPYRGPPLVFWLYLPRLPLTKPLHHAKVSIHCGDEATFPFHRPQRAGGCCEPAAGKGNGLPSEQDF